MQEGNSVSRGYHRLPIVMATLLLVAQIGHAQSSRSDRRTVGSGPCKEGERPVPIIVGGRQSIQCVKVPLPPAPVVSSATPGVVQVQPHSPFHAWTWSHLLSAFVAFVKSEWWFQLLLILLAGIAIVLFRIYRARHAQCRPKAPEHNGIGVSAPKLYDTRSLSLMMDEMLDQLRRLNNISQQPLSDAGTSVQDQRSTNFDWVAAGAASKRADPKAQLADTGTIDKANLNLPAVTPATSATKSLGERPVDLLSDQVNLTYEVLNLRLILERALSDRIFEGEPRLQAVLGFPISITPPEYASGCCANIEVSISSKAGEPPSVVALLPQERTFNSAVETRRSGSVSLGGPFKWLNLGFQGRGSSAENSLDRLPETIGTLGTAGASETRFGWQFRPIAGRTSVTAGMRQMFAVLALPQQDLKENDKLSLTINIRTNWRRFNRRTAISSDRLNLRAWFSDRPVSETHVWPKGLDVGSTVSVEENLKPCVDKIIWQPVSVNRAVVTVTGSNFFPGTAIIVGEQNYRTPDDGLVIKSEKTLQLTLPLNALIYDAILDGRYGPSMPLLSPPDSAGLPAIKFDWVSLSTPVGAKVAQLKMSFVSLDGVESIDWRKFSGLPDPLLQVNDKILNTPLYFYPAEGKGPLYSRIECWTLIPSDLVPTDNCLLVLKFPFLGPQWTFPYQLFLPHPKISVTRAAAGDRKVSLMILGKEGTTFGTNSRGEKWSVKLDKTYEISADGELQLVRSNLMVLSVMEDIVKKFDTLVILPPPDGGAIILPVPPPNVDATKSAEAADPALALIQTAPPANGR